MCVFTRIIYIFMIKSEICGFSKIFEVNLDIKLFIALDIYEIRIP